MSEFEIPPVEFVPAEDIVDVSSKNRLFLHAKYEGDVVQFRAEIIERLLGHNALHGAQGWLFYRESQADISSVITDARPKETFIGLLLNERVDEQDQRQVPLIRIITNTEYRLNAETAFLTEDITIDRAGKSQMLVDVLIQNDDGEILGGLDGSKSRAPLIILRHDGSVIFLNLEELTPSIKVRQCINAATEELSVVKPFGTFANLEDSIAALDWARAIVAETANAELVGWNTAD